MTSSTQVATVCGYCGVGCGMSLHVTGQTVTKASGRAEHPANRGRLCTKGTTTADMLRAGGRLTGALVRAQRDGDAEQVAVSDAVATVATRLSAIRDQYGPDAIALYVSGQMTIEAQYLANKLAKGYLRTPWIESNSRLCMASAGTGYKQSLGADGPPGSYDDLDTADLFVVIGSNMADCHPILFLRMMDRVRAGAKLVVVDPRRTATAAKADIHLPVRPGTDLALLNGLLRLVRDTGAVDGDFVAAYTEGWDAVDAMLDDYPADVVAGLTGVPEADLRAVAELISGTRNWVSLWTMGLNQSIHGTWNTNALCNLHLATGAICRPGAGPFSLTGQPNAMGGREMGYMGPGLPGQRSALDDSDREFTEQRWALPPGTIRAEAGAGTIEMFRRMAAGEIRAAWIICTNPVASVANRSEVIAGLQQAEFVVVQDAFTGVETAAYADVVLPAALWAETEGVMVNSERTLTHCGAAMPPPGEAMADWELICRVATAMGYPGFDFDSAAEVFDELRNFHNPSTGWDVRGVDYDRLRRGPVQWPAAPDGSDRNPIRYLNDGVSQDLHIADDGSVPALAFATPSRRARFLPRPHLPAAELPDDEFPLVFTTGRLAHQWHTMTKTGRVAKLNKLNPEPFLQIHPDDAGRLRIRDGDRVEIRSRRGRTVLPAALDDAVRPGVCFAPMHWADAFGPDLAVNAITNDAVDADSLQPEFKACAVSVTAVESDCVAVTPTMLEARSPVDAFATALGSLPSAPVLTEAEGLYLAGLVAGIRTNPPAPATLPALPAQTPLSPPHRAWVDGLLAGIFCRTEAPAQDGPRDVEGPALTATVVWASQTGTAEAYASVCVDRLGGAGIGARLRGAEEVSVTDLTGTVLFVVATTGDGDPPDNGIALWDALAAAEPGDIDALQFSVLGFGDSSYADFCGFARKLDARLEHLGARRVAERGSCEPDYESAAHAWTERVVSVMRSQALRPEPATPSPRQSYARSRPLRTTVIANSRLCGDGSDKDVRDVAVHLPPDTVRYGTGDALGVFPHNRADTVAEFLDVTGLDGAAQVDGHDGTLADILRTRLDITKITPKVVRFVHQHSGSGELSDVIDDPAGFADWLWGRQLLDLLASHPVTAGAHEWLQVLRPLTPRLYSISSSPREDPTVVRVTPGIVRFESRGAVTRHGVCSGHLADLEVGAEIDVFVQSTRHFRPPEDPDARMIMIGPGTGIAPFRGFLHERAGRGHRGDNWLFFGERHEATEFYYRDELEAFVASGVLTRLDTAFSRDGEAKVYVQDRLRDNAADVWKWISDGAHVYVCGDAARMARDVDETLQGIVAQHSGRSPKSAAAYLQAMSAEHRYVRDVY